MLRCSLPPACEGTSTLFEVNYIDDQKAYLTQSGQLYAEAIAMALGKVYTFGPPFAPKNRRPADISLNSGCSSQKAAYVESTKPWRSAKAWSAPSYKASSRTSRANSKTLKRDNHQTRKREATVPANQL